MKNKINIKFEKLELAVKLYDELSETVTKSDYYKNPKLGVKIDSCQILTQAKPKAIYFDRLSYNGWTWDQYGIKCLEPILSSNYVKIHGKPYYIRNDLATAISH